MENCWKGVGLLALVALAFATSCSKTSIGLRSDADESPRAQINKFMAAFSRDHYSYDQYLAGSSSFKPSRAVLFRGKKVRAFDYGAIGYCFPIDNRSDMLGNGKRKAEIDTFECILNGNNVILKDIVDITDKIIFHKQPSDVGISLTDEEGIKLSEDEFIYKVSFISKNNGNINVDALLISSVDIMNDARRNREYPLLSKRVVEQIGSEIRVKRIIFHRRYIY